MTVEKAMIIAHQRGLAYARAGSNRDYVNVMANKLTVEEGDALLAGYYAEWRRMDRNRLNTQLRINGGASIFD